MNLTFLGTAAANGYPEPFCSCDNCQQARALGGPSLRKRSAALINDDLLIDLGPDVLPASNQLGRPLTRVAYCLQTHAHNDHLEPSQFYSRSPGYGTVGAPRLRFYASAGSLQEIARLLAPDTAPASFLDPAVAEELNLEIHPVKAFEPFTLGRYRAIGFPAAHDHKMEPLLYAIEGEGRSLFYGTDSDSLPEAAWKGFRRFEPRFNLVILDHTYGTQKTSADHMDAYKFMVQVERMRAEGYLAEGARILATHIAHDGNPPHPEISAFAAQHGYEIAYDGLTVTV